MLKEIKLKYGKSTCHFEIPNDSYVDTLNPKKLQPLADLDSAVSDSLSDPVNSESFREKLEGVKSLLILTVDITRPCPTPVMKPILRICRELNIQVSICICLGRHGFMEESDLRDFLTPEIYDNYKVIQHDAFDDSIHLDAGTTSRGTPIKVNKLILEHDFVCGVSFIEPSYLMGFSGGRKLIMPGISHYSSIDANHFWLTHPNTRIGELDANPMHQDAMEFLEKYPLDWLICAVLDGTDKTVKIFSGHPVDAHRQSCDESKDIFKVNHVEADIVISSPGGYPYDMDLVQGKKGIVPALECVKPGGCVIILAACPQGWGAESAFKDWLLNKKPEQVVKDVKDQELFNLGAHGAYILAKPIVEKQASVILITNKELADDLSGSYIHTAGNGADAIKLAKNLCNSKNPDYLFMENSRRLIVN